MNQKNFLDWNFSIMETLVAVSKGRAANDMSSKPYVIFNN